MLPPFFYLKLLTAISAVFSFPAKKTFLDITKDLVYNE